LALGAQLCAIKLCVFNNLLKLGGFGENFAEFGRFSVFVG
jgi:hypothetical protein